MSFKQPFLLGPVFFRTAFPCSDSYHLEMAGMRLHDSVGAQLLNIKAHMSSIWAKGCMVMIVCVSSDLHDYPYLVKGERHGILLL